MASVYLLNGPRHGATVTVDPWPVPQFVVGDLLTPPGSATYRTSNYTSTPPQATYVDPQASISYADNSPKYAQGVPGDQGPQGIQGTIGPTGPAGANGVSLVIKGVWVSTTLYATNDLVQYTPPDGLLGGYVVKAGAFPLEGNLPTDTTKWLKISEKGPVGAAGATGPKGDAGPIGPTGPAGGAAQALSVTGTLSLPGEPTPGALQKIAANTVVVDTGPWWNAVSARYIPQSPGRYLCTAMFNGTQVGGAGTFWDLGFRKNGAQPQGFNRLPSSTSYGPNITVAQMFVMNGTTDYLELFGGQGNGVAITGDETIEIVYLGPS